MQYFIPSGQTPPLRILADALSSTASVPLSVARAAIELHSQPGDVILDPFCVGTSVIQAALDLGRKVIAASFNPINILAIEATLWPVDARSAFTHLSDLRKGSERLRDHVLDLYQTRCPTCGRDARAVSFVWDRDRNAPVEKHTQCDVCGENISAIDETDIAHAKRFEPRGLSFWILHGRVIDRAHEDADRVSEVLDAYTPRTQNALSDILLKFDGLPEADRSALRPALLATFDACTSLHAPEQTHRLAGLRPPPRFVEKNVWLELEQQVLLHRSIAASLHRSPAIEALLKHPSPSVALIITPARDLPKHLPEKSIPLLLAHPPLPRPGFWSLSVVWAAWLWGKSTSDSLLSLLSRKRTSWDWQWRAIASALNALAPALKEEARSVMAFANDEAILESVTLAVVAANQLVDHLVCDPHDGVRVTWRLGSDVKHVGQDATPHKADRADVLSYVRDAAIRIVRDRAEPTAWPVLQAGIYAALGQSAALAQIARQPESEQLPLAVVRDTIKAALVDAPLIEFGEHTWWVKDAGSIGAPLADRVEWIVADLLRSRDEWLIDDLLREVYRHFPDHLTPDRALVATCITSYAEELSVGRVRLRGEDAAEARLNEANEVAHSLMAIGARLGLEARGEERGAEGKGLGAGAVIWEQTGAMIYSFMISTTAEIDGMLREGEGVWVIPGGRATLLQHKMLHDPRLHRSIWHLLKFSSVRHMAQHADLSLEAFRLAFGLEPPIERPVTQIQLW